MIIALKAVKATSLAIPIAELMAEAIRMDGRLAGDEIVVPVPVSADTLAGRGFNQAELIGDSLAKKLGLDFKPRALKKVRSTPDQASLSRLYRLRNLDGCFSAKESLVSGRSILLLDDVITTGATAQACATVLRAAGARKVVLATAAFTLSDDRTVPDGSATEILHSGAQR
ncbi:MAG: phosphoribosyltransferase family protein [Candidatus Brocadiia bacterium]